MIDAAVIWNDAGAGAAADAVARANPAVKRVLGGVAADDAALLADGALLGRFDAVLTRGFPYDWSLWPVDAWPERIAALRAALPGHEIWAEAGAGSFGADEVQLLGFDRMLALLAGRVDRLYWHSLLDAPRAWGADSRHREAEGSSYYRLFYLGLVRDGGEPKPALEHALRHTPRLGIAQPFEIEDGRLEAAVQRLRQLGVRRVSTRFCYADSLRTGWQAWTDRLMTALASFETSIAFHAVADPLSPDLPGEPPALSAFADFCGETIARHASPRKEALVA